MAAVAGCCNLRERSFPTVYTHCNLCRPSANNVHIGFRREAMRNGRRWGTGGGDMRNWRLRYAKSVSSELSPPRNAFEMHSSYGQGIAPRARGG